ncbi:MAG: hypothetical protein PF436_10210 [Prolixibacteraceae bacterium]|nr:hypothetical protein [Prolixibacteraceae bacterium]
MNTKKEQDEAFEYHLKEISDDKIISILQHREHFQKHAVQAAIKEALHRGIITSHNDLIKPEFQPKPQGEKTLFPVAATDALTFGIFKSLCRISYLYGLIPIIFAVFQYIKNEYLIGTAAIITGIGIITLVYKLEKTMLVIYSKLLLTINIPVILISIFFVYSFNQNSAMDIFALACIILITLYITFYLLKLSRHLNSETV